MNDDRAVNVLIGKIEIFVHAIGEFSFVSEKEEDAVMSDFQRN